MAECESTRFTRFTALKDQIDPNANSDIIPTIHRWAMVKTNVTRTDLPINPDQIKNVSA